MENKNLFTDKTKTLCDFCLNCCSDSECIEFGLVYKGTDCAKGNVTYSPSSNLTLEKQECPDFSPITYNVVEEKVGSVEFSQESFLQKIEKHLMYSLADNETGMINLNSVTEEILCIIYNAHTEEEVKNVRRYIEEQLPNYQK